MTEKIKVNKAGVLYADEKVLLCYNLLDFLQKSYGVTKYYKFCSCKDILQLILRGGQVSYSTSDYPSH